MNYYIIAGEASGDLHGSNLMKSLLKKDPQATFRFWGGDLMEQVGGNLVKHYRELAFMGFAEVLLNIKTIFKNIAFCKNDIQKFNPDVIIFIDYPGFNMRIAKWAKANGYRTHYYISPQIWAWKESRIKSIKRDFDKLYVILPFEKDYYLERHQYTVEFVGHPLIDAIQSREKIEKERFLLENKLQNKPIIAVLPGSRKQEVSKLLHVMLSIVHSFPEYQFVIAGAPSLEFEFYKPFLKGENVHFISNKTYDLLSHATAAMVTSGTATLETALFGVPEVVCYKGSKISYAIAKRIINLKYISLVNLIMDEEVVTELIQDQCDSKNLKQELVKILDPKYREKMIGKYNKLEQKLGGVGASDNTAKLILDNISR